MLKYNVIYFILHCATLQKGGLVMEDVKNDSTEKVKKTRVNNDGDSDTKLTDDVIADIENCSADAKVENIEAIPLESLLYDAEDEVEEYESAADAEKFEAFLADYKEIMAETLAAAKTEAQEIAVDAAESPAHEQSPEENPEVNDEAKDSADREILSPSTDKYSENDIVLVETEEKIEEQPSADEEADEDQGDSLDYDGEQMEIDFGEPEANAPPTEPRESDEYDPEHPRKIDAIFEFVELFIFTFVAVMIATTFFFRHAIVDGPSMQNTLQNNDRLIIYSFLYEPERGDVIVFTHDKTLVKRVIAIEGDTVRVKCIGRTCEVWVNDEKIEEPYVHVDGDITTFSGEYVVGEDEVFVLGDHRNNSTDSRMFGTVNEDAILGKVVLRFYPKISVIK